MGLETITILKYGQISGRSHDEKKQLRLMRNNLSLIRSLENAKVYVVELSKIISA